MQSSSDPSPAGGHLTDDALSASLDGALGGGSDVAADEHLSVCSACRSRRADLEQVAASLGSGMPVLPQSLATALIARAVDQSVAAPLDRRTDLHMRGPRRRRRQSVIHAGRVAGIAAVLALVVGVPALLSSLSGLSGRGGTDSSAARSPSGGENAVGDEESASGGTGNVTTEMSRAPAVDITAPDLGQHTDAGVLATRVRQVLGTREPTERTSAVVPQSAAAPPAPTAPSPSAERCMASIRAADGTSLAVGRHVGSARWRGEPSLVLAFDMSAPSAGATGRLYVVAPVTCEVLATAQW